VLVVLWSGLASAQSAAPSGPAAGTDPGIAAPPGDTWDPGFVVIDRIDGSSRAGFEAAYLQPNSKLGDVSLLRFEAHARYVDPGTGVGAYTQVPFAYAHGGGSSGETITDFGDLEVGVVYAAKPVASVLALVVHAGVTVPTGERNAEAFIGTIENFVALPELYNSLPRAFTGKFGVSQTAHRGNVFARLDLGLDVNFDADQTTVANAIHVDAGLGATFGRLAAMLELENATVLDRTDASGTTVKGATMDALAVSLRGDAGAVLPYLAVTIPLEHDVSDVVDFVVTAGVDFKLR